jgi:hypothetical protein
MDKTEDGHVHEWKPIMQFLDGSETFCRGFSMGVLWAELKERPKTHSGLFISTCEDQALQIASVQGYKVISLKTSDGWTSLELELK